MASHQGEDKPSPLLRSTHMNSSRTTARRQMNPLLRYFSLGALVLSALVALWQSLRVHRSARETHPPDEAPLPIPAPHVSIILPVRNEEATLDACLARCWHRSIQTSISPSSTMAQRMRPRASWLRGAHATSAYRCTGSTGSPGAGQGRRTRCTPASREPAVNGCCLLMLIRATRRRHCV